MTRNPYEARIIAGREAERVRRREESLKKEITEDYQVAIDNLFDILIEAGILELSLRGQHPISTSNYHGRFNVNSIPASKPLPGPTASKGRGR